MISNIVRTSCVHRAYIDTVTIFFPFPVPAPAGLSVHMMNFRSILHAMNFISFFPIFMISSQHAQECSSGRR